MAIARTKRARKSAARSRRSHIPLEVFEKEARAADGARRRARLDVGFAPDVTAVRARARRGRAATAEPAQFDLLRDSSGIRVGPPVRDQGAAGSCTANATISAMETLAFVRHGTVPGLSAEHAFETGSEREEMSVAVRVAARGILESGCFDPNPPCATPKQHTWIGQFRLLTEGDNDRPAAMRRHLLAGKPLVAVIRFFPNFRTYAGGVFIPEGQSTVAHAVAVVGYEKNDSPAGGVWICRNSFGPGWGDQGYVLTEWGDDFLDLERIVYVLEDVRTAQ